MKNDLVKLYNAELAALRKDGEAFADAHPKIAGRLKLGQGGVEDPMVGRLLESFAFLTARSHYHMQAEVQQLEENLLQLLYPHYFLPIPACSILKFQPSEQLTEPYTLSAKTQMSTSLLNGDKAYFTTSYPVTVRPLHISRIQYRREGNIKPKQYEQKELKSCLTLTLKTNQENLSLSDLKLESLRLFINAASHSAGQLYELCMNHVKEIIMSYGSNWNTINIPAHSIEAVGFTDDESLLPHQPTSFTGYRLLTEYFAYPEKFLFFDIKGLDSFIEPEAGNTVQLHIYFDYYFADLEKLVDNGTLLPHCTPIINLFEKDAEIINFNQQQESYHVIADADYSPENIEVYSISSIDVSSAKLKDIINCAPYFGKTFTQQSPHYIYWHVSRKPCELLGQPHTPGSEVFINISDFNLETMPDDLKLMPHLLCTNRDAPQHLPFGGGKPEWAFDNAAHELIHSMQCVKTITQAKYRHTREASRVQLAQHIYLNQIGYSNPNDTLKTIKTILSLYCFGQEHDNKLLESGIVEAQAKAIIARHPKQLQQGFCRGIQYEITIDETHFPDADPYLFGCVLNEFLTKSCSINDFVSLSFTSLQRGELFKWQAKFGVKPIL